MERSDNALFTLYSALQRPGFPFALTEMGKVWGRYIDDLSCGITSYVTGRDSDPPRLGTIGYIQPCESGLSFKALSSSYKGAVHVRSTYQLITMHSDGTYVGDKTEKGYISTEHVRYVALAEFVIGIALNAPCSLPVGITREKSMLLANKTIYSQLDSRSWAVEHLVCNASELVKEAGIAIESLVIGKSTVVYTK